MNSKKYERSIRKLRKFMHTTQDSYNVMNLAKSIQKARHGNLNNSIMATGSRKFETALSQIEKVGNFATNYNKPLCMKPPIDKPKKAHCEIIPGFLRDNNLRIVYEALKVND